MLFAKYVVVCKNLAFQSFIILSYTSPYKFNTIVLKCKQRRQFGNSSQ